MFKESLYLCELRQKVVIWIYENGSFGFFDYKLASAASRMIHYRWTGWVLIALGSLTMILFSGKNKRKID